MRRAVDLPVVTYLSMDPVASTVGYSQVLAYVERLGMRGLSVDLVSFEESVDLNLRERLAVTGVNWRPHQFGRHGAFGGLGRVVRAARAIRGVEMVHARSDMAAAAAMLAGVDNWVWDVRSLWVDQKVATGVVPSGSPQEKVMRFVERCSAQRSSAVVTLTGSAIEELDRRYDGLVSPKGRVITTCVDLDRFGVSPMPQMPLRVLLAGTVNRYYDVRTMLNLVAELRRRRPVEFIVASPGEPDWDDELAGVEATRVSASTEEMVDLVASCHVGLSVCHDDAGVSLKAAMPTKIGEFLASGRPVVVNPGLVDAAGLLERHECGVVYGSLVPERMLEAADLIEQRVADPHTPARCRELAEDHFDLERGVDQLVATYELVCSSG